MFLKVFTAIAVIFTAIAFGAVPSQAAGDGSFAISVSYPGCSGASGYVNYSGVTAYDSSSGYGAPGDGIGIEVDAVFNGGYARWSGQGVGNASSGSVHYSMSWSNLSLPAGSTVRLQVWVWDAKTFFYIPSPSNNGAWQETSYTCTTAAPPPGVSVVPSYYVPDPNKGYSVMATVKVTTAVYASPSSTSATAGTIKAGQTWFIVGTAHNRTWYQIFVGGPDLVWVPASTMSPMGKVPTGKSYSNGDGTFSPAAGGTSSYTPGSTSNTNPPVLPPTPVAPTH